jgi:hypothetical protein
MIDKSFEGWKELEYEILRDSSGSVSAVCNMVTKYTLEQCFLCAVMNMPCHRVKNSHLNMRRKISMPLACTQVTPSWCVPARLCLTKTTTYCVALPCALQGIFAFMKECESVYAASHSILHVHTHSYIYTHAPASSRLSASATCSSSWTQHPTDTTSLR